MVTLLTVVGYVSVTWSGYRLPCSSPLEPTGTDRVGVDLRPNLFASRRNTFSKWWEGLRMACRRVLRKVWGSDTVWDSGERKLTKLLMWFCPVMRWLSLFLACQHLNSGTNLRECEDQSWFKVQAVPVFRFDWYKVFSRAPGWRPRGTGWNVWNNGGYVYARMPGQ
jgi:hypothetical protein